MRKVQCLDIGNTTTKIGFFEDDKICKLKQIETKSLISDSEKFIDLISGENGDLCYCSVVPNAEKNILEALNKFEGSIHVVSPSFCAGIPISYQNKKEIGSDRIANAIATYYTLSLPAVVIDLGTATTFDIVTKKGGYEGGIILPGPQGFLDFLNENTALLPKVELSNERSVDIPYGKNTKDAMLAGVSLGYKSMINALIENLKDYFKKEHGDTPTFAVCGGSSINLDFNNSILKENLTLLGLRLAYEFYYKEKD
ncbi:MAG TPA: hypothetical protein DCF87_01735 [Opitutae bacterium]|nr:hypothetical protein [Opitutae bacterium]